MQSSCAIMQVWWAYRSLPLWDIWRRYFRWGALQKLLLSACLKAVRLGVMHTYALMCTVVNLCGLLTIGLPAGCGC